MKYNLSKEQLKAIELLGVGYSISETSKEININRSTLYRWLNTDENFKKAKSKFETTLYNDLWCVAVGEMQDILINGTVNQKIPIIQLVSKLNGKLVEKSETSIKKEIDIDDFLNELGV